MNRPLRILVAEHDENDFQLLRRAFDDVGVEVPIRFVRDGGEAIDYLTRKDPLRYPESCPNVLLLDLNMPGLNGFDVLRWLRTKPELSRLLVFAFSSSEAAEDVHRAYELGADSYIGKPESPEEFLETVRDMERLWLRLNATPECGSACEFPEEAERGPDLDRQSP